MITQGDGQGRDKDRTAARQQQESISEEDEEEEEEAIVISLPFYNNCKDADNLCPYHATLCYHKSPHAGPRMGHHDCFCNRAAGVLPASLHAHTAAHSWSASDRNHDGGVRHRWGEHQISFRKFLVS